MSGRAGSPEGAKVCGFPCQAESVEKAVIQTSPISSSSIEFVALTQEEVGVVVPERPPWARKERDSVGS